MKHIITYIITYNINTKTYAWTRESDQLINSIESEDHIECIFICSNASSTLLHYQTCCLSEKGKCYASILKAITSLRSMKLVSSIDTLFYLHESILEWHGYEIYADLSHIDCADSGIF